MGDVAGMVELILQLMVDAVIFVVTELVDWCRWWRFWVSVVGAGMAAVVFYHFCVNSMVLPLVLVIPVLGITAGFIWERRTQKR